MNNDKLVDSLEIWGFEDNYIIYGDGSIGSALSVSPVDVSCWEDDGVNSLSERLCQFLNALPEDIDVQYIQDICKGNDEILSAHEATRHKECSEISTALSAERLEGLRSLDSEGLIPSHRLTMVVRKSLPLKGKMRSQIFSKPKKFD